MKKLLPWVLVCIAIAIAVFPWFGTSYIPTHDGEYHIIRIVEFSKMLAAGYAFPRWAPDLNSGYGIPIFNFHYPFPNYVGSFVRLFTHDAVYAYQYAVGIGYILAGIFLFLWLRSVFNTRAACIGTIVGIFVPYWFVTQYVRGSIGEVWATAFLFLVLLLGEKQKKVLLALAYAFLILSHNILALLYTPFLVCYWLVKKKYINLAAMVFGVMIACFFWLPALVESKFVVGLNTVRLSDHFIHLYEFLIPSWGTAFSGDTVSANKMSFQLGIVPFLVVIASLVAISREKNSAVKQEAWYMMAVLAVSCCLMFPWSMVVWRSVPLIPFIQYPWRLLSFGLVVVPFLAAYGASSKKRFVVGILLAVLSVAFSYSYTRPVLYQPRTEAYYMIRPNFTDGTSSMGNSFSTIWTPWKETRAKEKITVIHGRVVQKEKDTYLEKRLRLDMDEDGEIVVHTLYFPGWHVYLDGIVQRISYEQDGIIHVSLPKGQHDIVVIFGDTPVRTTATVISAIGLVGLLAWGILSYRGKKQAL